jgi:putative transposase
VSLHANLYQVDELLVGRKVELVFDPFDLTEIEVRYGGRSFGAAVAFTIGRHVHPKARPEQPAPAAAPTGIDYLHLIDTAHTEALQLRINYAALTDQLPGQLDLLTGAPADGAPADGAVGEDGPRDGVSA